MVKHDKVIQIGLTTKQISVLAGVRVTNESIIKSKPIRPRRSNGVQFMIAHKQHFKTKLIDKYDAGIHKAEELLRHLRMKKAKKLERVQQQIAGAKESQ